MGYDHQRIKSNAKAFYQNNRGSSILTILIFMGISLALSLVTYIIVSAANGGAYISDDNLSIPAQIAQYLLNIIVGLAGAPLTMGIMNWYRQSIYRQTSLNEVFTPYKQPYLWSNILTSLLMTVKLWLWTLLFIIPGIIKAYSYSQTMYIKAENPNISPSRAIELSKIMMNGHKWDLFYLHLSFIGWIILSAFTIHILGIVYVFPYYYAAQAFAYEEIKADAAARGVIDIREINPNFYSGEVYPQ